MGVRRVVPVLHASDPAASGQFYSDLLGLDVGMDLDRVVNLISPENASAQVLLMREDATAPVRPDASIEVDDVDAAYAAAEHRGSDIVHPLTDEPWGVRRFFVRDPNGNVINVLAHRPA